MADFLPPFGEDASLRRLPTPEEQALGLLCGPAARALFIGLFNRIEKELGEIITFAGFTPDNGDMAQVRKSIQAMIAAATGGGSTADYLLVSQARARLPIFPEVQTGDGKVGVTVQGAGVARLPASVTFLHRGVVPVTTAQTDFNTVASKTYHLRWYAPGVGRAQPLATYPSGRWFLEDLADTVTYNPGSAADDAAGFDSTYDNMLVARIVTNSSNVLTVTNLANLAMLTKSEYGVAGSNTNLNPNYQSTATADLTLDWARRPRMWVAGGFHNQTGGPPLEWAGQVQKILTGRYKVTASVSSNWLESYPQMAALAGYLNFDAMA